MRSALFLFLIACGGDTKSSQTTVSTQPPATGSQPMTAQPMVAANEPQPTCAEANVACAIDTLAYFSKKMCVCKDKGCADNVNNSMTKWGEEMAKNAPAMNTKPTEAEQKKVMEVVTKYTDCMTKLMMDGQSPPHVDPSDPCGGGGDPCGD